MLLPAPGRVSTTNCWPSVWLIVSPTMRAVRSAAEPGGKPTISRMGREGKSSAGACGAAATATSARVKPNTAMRCMAFFPSVPLVVSFAARLRASRPRLLCLMAQAILIERASRSDVVSRGKPKCRGAGHGVPPDWPRPIRYFARPLRRGDRMKRRKFLTLLGGAAFARPYATRAQAPDYPTRPVRIISDSAPGSAIDATMRIIADALSRTWGQQAVLINQPGAGGALAARAAATAPADGYTLFIPALSAFVAPPGAA